VFDEMLIKAEVCGGADDGEHQAVVSHKFGAGIAFGMPSAPVTICFPKERRRLPDFLMFLVPGSRSLSQPLGTEFSSLYPDCYGPKKIITAAVDIFGAPQERARAR
jgi:hypothetical protein